MFAVGYFILGVVRTAVILRSVCELLGMEVHGEVLVRGDGFNGACRESRALLKVFASII